MILRLDARFPVVWRSPSSLQFGADAPALVLDEVSLPTEHMVAAIGAGVTRSGLLMVGKSAGATEQEVVDFIELVGPVLQVDSSVAPHSVVIVGTGRTAERTGQLLASAGFDVVIAADLASAEEQPCDFAVIVASYVVEPSHHGLWLRRDIPHLAIVLGDSGVQIGPIIVPGVGPCLYCLQRHATDADPAWPAIATQLWGRRSTADTELLACEVAAMATRIVVGRFSGEDATEAGMRMIVDVVSGEVSEVRFAPHPECGCLEAGETNARALASSTAPGSTPPRTD